MTEQAGAGTDPAALWLVQLPGMTPDLLRRLLATFGSPAATVGASSGALRGLGLAPAQVARIVAGAREVPQVAAGLKGLERLGIVPLPFGTPRYPQRLLDLPAPPLVLYAQGRWPISVPLAAIVAPDPVEPALAEAWAALVAELGPHVGFASGGGVALAVAPRLLGVPFGLMLARQRLPSTIAGDVAAGRTTLLSLAPPTAQPGSAAATAGLLPLQSVLALLSEAAIALAPVPDADPLLDAARGHGKRVFVFGAPPRQPIPAGMRRLRPGKPGAQALRSALGLNLAGTEAVQQERLF